MMSTVTAFMIITCCLGYDRSHLQWMIRIGVGKTKIGLRARSNVNFIRGWPNTLGIALENMNQVKLVSKKVHLRHSSICYRCSKAWIILDCQHRYAEKIERALARRTGKMNGVNQLLQVIMKMFRVCRFRMISLRI
ncbi:hypothetical protein C8R42DRAFT_667387 [Lentinula raphanica]|nr:hypothetical protein C8R42DRAFT_667387 [Lentinula raphanica]